MSGKILIVDGVATNRIVLKVKLSAAFYDVLQAGSGQEARQIVARARPDIVIVSAGVPDEDAETLIRDIAARPAEEAPAVIALTEADAPALRLALLEAGACDVMVRPLCEQVLLARLRSLARRRRAQEDLAMGPDAADALGDALCDEHGFAERHAPFGTRGQVVAIEPESPGLQACFHALERASPHDFALCTIGKGGSLTGLTQNPDVILIALAEARDDPGLSCLAELRIASLTRHARLIAVVENPDTPLAGMALDLGADDVVGVKGSVDEFDLRIAAQMRRKRADDHLRTRLQSGMEAAITDPLTGLYNRRYALSALGRLAARAAQTGEHFAVMVADLDHFKSVNDTYGHTAGDIVLTRVATQLRTAISEGDMLARFGGEEFLILLPGADRQQAQDAADAVRQLVRETEISLPGRSTPIQVTISIGVTVARLAPNENGPTVDCLLDQADQALYGSKSEGRDTVTFNRLSAA